MITAVKALSSGNHVTIRTDTGEKVPNKRGHLDCSAVRLEYEKTPSKSDKAEAEEIAPKILEGCGWTGKSTYEHMLFVPRGKR